MTAADFTPGFAVNGFRPDEFVGTVTVDGHTERLRGATFPTAAAAEAHAVEMIARRRARLEATR